MLERLLSKDQIKFFSVLPGADRALALAWWVVLALRGVLPAVFAIAIGLLVGAVERNESLTLPLVLVGAVFIPLQVLSAIHRAIGANLGSRTASSLYDRLTRACVRPPGMGHLEDPKLTSDFSMARDFDMGITGPPIWISMDFIASGLVEMIAGLTSAAILAGFAWWAPLVLAGAWLATHWLLKESAVWRDRNTDEVRGAQRHADYAYRLAVDAPPPRSCASSAWQPGRSTGSGPTVAGSSSFSGKPRACASGQSRGASSWSSPRILLCSAPLRSPRPTAHSRSTASRHSPRPPSPPA